MICCARLRALNRKFGFLLFCCIFAYADSSIYLKSHVAQQKALQLRDIATLQSDNKRVKNYIGSLPIPKALYRDGVITQEEVRRLLQDNLIDTHHIHIVGRVVIDRQAPLSKEELYSAIRSYVLKHYSNVQVERISCAIPKNLKGYIERIVPSSTSFRHIYLDVAIHTDQNVLHCTATVAVQRYGEVPVALHDIMRGMHIQPQDITYEKRKLTSSMQLRTLARDVIGSIARSTIRAGTVIRSYMIMPDFAVKKYHSVKIVYQKGPIRIELLGLALENGNKGDIVRVKNLSSNKVLRCRVLQNGVVQYR